MSIIGFAATRNSRASYMFDNNRKLYKRLLQYLFQPFKIHLPLWCICMNQHKRCIKKSMIIAGLATYQVQRKY